VALPRALQLVFAAIFSTADTIRVMSFSKNAAQTVFERGQRNENLILCKRLRHGSQAVITA